jgi:hypothetical protein
MDTSSKTGKSSITKKGKNTRKPRQEPQAPQEPQEPRGAQEQLEWQQLYDADAELALALSNSAAELGASIPSFEDAEYQEHLLLLKHQSAADEEYARQLAAEYEAQNASAGASAGASAAIPADLHYRNTEDTEDTDDDINNIDKVDSHGRQQKTAVNINRILADEDEEEARIRLKVKRAQELNEWRTERARQDAEYAAMEEYDRARELSIQNAATSHPIESATATAPELAPTPEPAQDSVQEYDPVPLTKEELRKARLAFFTSARINANAPQ